MTPRVKGHLQRGPLLLSKLLCRCKIDHATGCWNWLGAKVSGYGRAKVDWKIESVHRMAYEAVHGPIPGDLVIDHLCRNPPCFNPDHLEVVTRGENVLRGIGPLAMNARKIQCKNGHERWGVEENGRYCKECSRKRAAARYQQPGNLVAATKTHCKRGHEMTPANTYIDPGGHFAQCRVCRAMHRVNSKAKEPA